MKICHLGNFEFSFNFENIFDVDIKIIIQTTSVLFSTRIFLYFTYKSLAKIEIKNKKDYVNGPYGHHVDLVIQTTILIMKDGLS